MKLFNLAASSFVFGYLISSCVWASDDLAADPADVNQWHYTATKRGKQKKVVKDKEAKPPVKEEANAEQSSFERTRKNTNLHIKSLQYLDREVKQFVTERQVQMLNSRLYNVGIKGQLAPGDPDHELYERHFRYFCSPLSGYEGKTFKECNLSNPLVLQHADLKPVILSDNRFDSNTIPVIENWIHNFFTSPVSPRVPDYIKDPKLMNTRTNRESYIRRLREQIPLSIAANSVNTMLARRIPVIPEDKDSPSIASSLAAEARGRYLNESWHEEIDKVTTGLDIEKEQLRVLSLLSFQMQELNERLERMELLNASLITLMSNHHESIEKIAQQFTKR